MGVRRAVESDLKAIHPLLEELVPAELGQRRATWTEALADEGYAAWVAEIDSTPAGFLDLVLLPDVAHGGTIGLIHNLAVDARFRGREVGESLLRAAIDHCRRHGVVELHLWTDFDNARAIRLYERLGFARRAVLMELRMEGMV
jgi:ribosomal protein S18 acetylase RimI-like enzyme